jgi:hypothetical protein
MHPLTKRQMKSSVFVAKQRGRMVSEQDLQRNGDAYLRTSSRRRRILHAQYDNSALYELPRTVASLKPISSGRTQSSMTFWCPPGHHSPGLRGSSKHQSITCRSGSSPSWSRAWYWGTHLPQKSIEKHWSICWRRVGP